MATVTDLAWLTGLWMGKAFAGTIEENFGSPEGGCILGTSRVVVDGKTVHREFISLEEHEETLAYVVILPSKTHVFRLEFLEGERVQWSDPDNEWPQTLLYERRGATLTVRLEGASKSGGRKVEAFEMMLRS